METPESTVLGDLPQRLHPFVTGGRITAVSYAKRVRQGRLG
jgi:hypothetical protein